MKKGEVGERKSKLKIMRTMSLDLFSKVKSKLTLK